MNFAPWPHNRLLFPTRHVLVCEDDLHHQARAAAWLAGLFGPQGGVIASFAPSADQAARICLVQPAVREDLILLDHDMPWGNGHDLLLVLRGAGLKIPVITFSGLDGNNKRLMSAGADHLFEKGAVLRGAADDIVKRILQEAP